VARSHGDGDGYTQIKAEGGEGTGETADSAEAAVSTGGTWISSSELLGEASVESSE
jgi:hypothetical protein